MNSVAVIGRLGADPELKHTQSGQALATLRLAFEQGQDKATGWVGVTCFGKTAEAVAQYVRKGDEVGIEGRLAHREWEAEGGGKRSALEIAANRVDFLRKKGEAAGGQQAARPEPTPAPEPQDDPFAGQ